MSRATCATIHIGALRENLARVRTLAPDSKVMAVIKADGYGHGLERVARALGDADAFGVAAIQDGLRLRAAGFDQRIVVLSGIDDPGDLAEMRRLDLESVIHSDDQLAWLASDSDRRPLRVWLKIDSGMHRLGFAPARARDAYATLRATPGIDPDIGWMTHFANSDVFDDAQTAQQIATFSNAIGDLPGARSLANSAAVLGWPDSHAPASREPASHESWVRVGGLLYGIAVVAGKTGADFGFRPAMTLATRLIAVHQIGKGERIGYAASYQCPEDMPIGVASIGYGDGYPRSAISGTPVLVNGHRAALVGRVSMDLITIDLRTQPGAKVGDPVVLWGNDLPVEEVAANAGTIGYDLVCGMTRRVRFVEAE